jgi:hypothetical protein
VAFHREFFADTGWRQRFTPLRRLVTAHAVSALYDVDYSDRDGDGAERRSRFLVVLVFVPDGDRWLLVHDQCTPLCRATGRTPPSRPPRRDDAGRAGPARGRRPVRAAVGARPQPQPGDLRHRVTGRAVVGGDGERVRAPRIAPSTVPPSGPCSRGVSVRPVFNQEFAGPGRG